MAFSWNTFQAYHRVFIFEKPQKAQKAHAAAAAP